VHSSQYKNVLKTKGRQVEEWNWQVAERNAGAYNEENQKDKKGEESDGFDLADEIQKVDDELRRESHR